MNNSDGSRTIPLESRLTQYPLFGFGRRVGEIAGDQFTSLFAGDRAVRRSCRAGIVTSVLAVLTPSPGPHPLVKAQVAVHPSPKGARVGFRDCAR